MACICLSIVVSFACGVGAVNAAVSEAAEVLRRDFLKRLLGVVVSTAHELLLQILAISHCWYKFRSRFCGITRVVAIGNVAFSSLKQ